MSKINLSGFCEVQKIFWENYTKTITGCICTECGEKKIRITQKWRCVCDECGAEYTIKKPKNFPKNMDDKRNWKSTCCECGGKMDYYENRSGGAYLCRKCGNSLEV